MKYYVTVEARMEVTADSELLARAFATATVGGSGFSLFERAAESVDVKGIDIIAITEE
jgi:hypothetical protein